MTHLDDDADTRIHQSIENVFTVLMAKHLITRKELRERMEAFCETERDEEDERERRAKRMDSIIAQACGDPE